MNNIFDKNGRPAPNGPLTYLYDEIMDKVAEFLKGYEGNMSYVELRATEAWLTSAINFTMLGAYLRAEKNFKE